GPAGAFSSWRLLLSLPMKTPRQGEMCRGEIKNSVVLAVSGVVGAAGAQALPILGKEAADHTLRQVHGHPQLPAAQLRRLADGGEGVPLAAPGAADVPDGLEGGGGGPVGQAPALPGQGRGPGGHAEKDPGADRRPAAAPEAASPAGNLLPPPGQLRQGG